MQVMRLTNLFHYPFPRLIFLHCTHLAQCLWAARLFQPRTATHSLYAGLKPPPLPEKLNANIHQSPLRSSLSSSLLCARACRSVGLIRPLLFTGVKQTTQHPGWKRHIAADRSNLSCPHTARLVLHKDRR